MDDNGGFERARGGSAHLRSKNRAAGRIALDPEAAKKTAVPPIAGAADDLIQTPGTSFGNHNYSARIALGQFEEGLMSLERMVLLVIGVIILGSVLLAVYQSSYWLWITGLMGAHLIQASFTGMCPVVAALKRLGFEQRAGFA